MTLLHAIAAAALIHAQSDLPAKYAHQRPESGSVIAKVGGKPILALELEPLLWDWRAYEVLQDVINARILAAEAERLKVSIADADVEKEIDAQLVQMAAQMPQGTPPEKWLLEQGFPRSRLYLRVRTQLLLDRIAAVGFNPERFVEVATIIVPVKSSQASDVADAIKRAQDAYDELKRGVSWDVVLRRMNPDPRFVENRGKIGWRELSAFPEATQGELATLEVGGITKPVQTQNGIQIFRVEQRGKDANEETRKSLLGMFLEKARQETLDRVRKEAKVEQLYPRPKAPG